MDSKEVLEIFKKKFNPKTMSKDQAILILYAIDKKLSVKINELTLTEKYATGGWYCRTKNHDVDIEIPELRELLEPLAKSK